MSYNKNFWFYTKFYGILLQKWKLNEQRRSTGIYVCIVIFSFHILMKRSRLKRSQDVFYLLTPILHYVHICTTKLTLLIY